MKTYEVVSDALEIHTGQLRLSAKQYATRRHALTETKKAGIYDVKGPVQFKRGEHVGIPGELPKSIAVLVEDIEKPKKPETKAEAKAREEAEAKAKEEAEKAEAAKKAAEQAAANQSAGAK